MSQSPHLSTFILFTIFALARSQLDEWSYDFYHPFGPQRWGALNLQCNGPRQSPISIDTKVVARNTLRRPLILEGVDRAPSLAEITNGPLTVKITFNFSMGPPTLLGGPLIDTYSLREIHFHWGLSNNDGSEHIIDNCKYAMEAHFVFHKQSLLDLNLVQRDPNGVVVIAILFKASPTGIMLPIDNFNDLMNEGGKLTVMDPPFSLRLFMTQLFIYATYKGSLTEPPCSENVDWVVSTDILEFNENQVRLFPFHIL